jgi:hypothetical protein
MGLIEIARLLQKLFKYNFNGVAYYEVYFLVFPFFLFNIQYSVQ